MTRLCGFLLAVQRKKISEANILNQASTWSCCLPRCVRTAETPKDLYVQQCPVCHVVYHSPSSRRNCLVSLESYLPADCTSRCCNCSDSVVLCIDRCRIGRSHHLSGGPKDLTATGERPLVESNSFTYSFICIYPYL